MSEETSQTTQQLNDHAGSCHCGNFKFSVRLPPLERAFACNCNICFRNSYLWVFPAEEEHFKVDKQDVELKGYQFGKREREHKFCPKCGTSIMASHRGAPQGRSIAINARVIHGVILDKLQVVDVDGLAMEPAYDIPQHPTGLAAEEGYKIYGGSCHCGAVTYSLKSKPLTKHGPKVATCDCSICARNGELWVYPRKADVFIHGEEALTDYVFGERTAHRFCNACGVSLFNMPLHPKVDMIPVNVRTLQGVEVGDLNIEVKYFPPITFLDD